MLIRGSVGRDDRREENREMRGWHVGSGFAGKRTDVEEAAVIEELKPAHRVETLRCVANTAGTSARPHPRAAPISRAKMRELRGHVCAPTSSSRARRGEGKTEEQEEAGGRRPVEAGTSPASCLAPCGAGETDAGVCRGCSEGGGRGGAPASGAQPGWISRTNSSVFSGSSGLSTTWLFRAAAGGYRPVFC